MKISYRWISIYGKGGWFSSDVGFGVVLVFEWWDR